MNYIEYELWYSKSICRVMSDSATDVEDQMEPGGSMTLANRIRACIDKACIRTARRSGRDEIVIRAGDVHSRMGLSRRMPAVCGALRSGKLQRQSGVELIGHTGPREGANACYRFRIVDREVPEPVLERQVAAAEARSTSQPPPRHIAPIGADAVVLVSCVSRKRSSVVPAKDLYLSDWFLKARRFAEGTGAPWFILSAEHGLVDPDEPIGPYEKTLNTMPVRERRGWADAVFEQLTTAAPDLERVMVLAGTRYREFLADRLVARGVAVEVPMKGLRIGEQLSWLGQQVRHG